ncbi:alcohol dehydrogenase [soil metagenome]
MISQSLVAYGVPLAERTAALPQPSGSEVLMRISACGVCHSDLHLQDGHFNLGGGKTLDIRALRNLPFTLGHEIAGRIEAAGPNASGLDRDMLYCVYPWIGCGTCSRCLSGREHTCDHPKQLGITVDGGYASHVLVPHPRYLIDATGLDPHRAGSLMCSGLTAFSAIRKAFRHRDRTPSLMIVGLGGVGIMAVEIAKALGADHIYGADIAPAKLEAGLAAGCTAVFDPTAKDARRNVAAESGGIEASVDFAGTESSLQFAQSIVAKGGIAVVVGLIGGSFTIPIPMFPLRELTISGSYVGSLAEARELVTLAQSGQLAPIPVTSYPLADANRSLDDLRAGSITGRAVLIP